MMYHSSITVIQKKVDVVDVALGTAYPDKVYIGQSCKLEQTISSQLPRVEDCTF